MFVCLFVLWMQTSWTQLCGCSPVYSVFIKCLLPAFRSPAKPRPPCSTGRCSRSCDAPLTWPVTPLSPSPSAPWRLPSSAAPAPSLCSPRRAGEAALRRLPQQLSESSLWSAAAAAGARTAALWNFSIPTPLLPSNAGLWSVPTFTICFLLVTFWDVNPDILQVNFNSLFIPLSMWHRRRVSWTNRMIIAA